MLLMYGLNMLNIVYFLINNVKSIIDFTWITLI